MNMKLKFDRCRRSLAPMAPVKYESDYLKKSIRYICKIENFPNGETPRTT